MNGVDPDAVIEGRAAKRRTVALLEDDSSTPEHDENKRDHGNEEDANHTAGDWTHRTTATATGSGVWRDAATAVARGIAADGRRLHC